jgi:uncharacterized membrane protein
MTRAGNSRYLRVVAVALPLAVALWAAASGVVCADDSQAPAAGAAPAQPLPANKPGFLHQLGVWWNDSFGDIDAKMKAARDKISDYNKQQDQAAKDASAATQQALKDAAQVTKDAATAVVKLPITRVIEFHDRCQVAGNGAPDCQTTANESCRKKGFGGGQPLDVSTSQECPARVMLSGRPPAAGECHDVTVVLRAVCQ